MIRWHNSWWPTISSFIWVVIIHPRPSFNGGLVKPPLKIGHEEIATCAMMATPTVAVSSYKKSKKPPQDDQAIKIKCTDCARAIPKVTMVRGRLREFKRCEDCWDKNRAAKTPEQALFQVVGVIRSRPQMSLFVQKRGKVAVRCPDQYTFKGPGLSGVLPTHCHIPPCPCRCPQTWWHMMTLISHHPLHRLLDRK